MRHSFSILVAVSLLGCGNAPDRPAETPVPSATMTASPAPAVSVVSSAVLDPSASAVAAPPSGGPAWLALPFDAQKTLPLRVAIAELGSVYAADSGLPMNSPSGASVDMRTFALEEPTDRRAERIRVLCEDAKTRVAVYLDRKDLATVARKGAALYPAPNLVDAKSAGASTPALTFASGTIVSLDTTSAVGAAKVRVRTAQLEADGFAMPDFFDQVYEADGTLPRITVDSELPRGADFYDKPGGKRFAKLLPRKPDDDHYFTEKVGDPQRGMVFVRAETRAGTLAGWVAVGALAAHGYMNEKGTPGVIGLGMIGATVTLEAGTFLDRGDPPVRLGVTLRQNRYACRSQCKGGMPVVLVDACGAKLELTSEQPVPARGTPKKK